MMSIDNDKVFFDAMSDVVPLKYESKVDLNRKTVRDKDSSLEHRRRAAAEMPESDLNTLSTTGVVPLDGWLVLTFKRTGVQNGVFRKLKQGRYEAECTLDLHCMNTEAARREVFEFIEEVHELGLRSVLMVHGKGGSKLEKERSSILKGCVDHWLRQLEIVQAFHSAQPRHGGTGAVYVLLRKSEKKKQENREKLSKGRVPVDPL